MITSKEANQVRKLANEISAKQTKGTWCCWLLKGRGDRLDVRFAKFFGQIPGKRWDGLNSPIDSSPDEKNLQRELMLELFALTRGKL